MMELDLDAVVDSVLMGRLNMQSAQEEIARYHDFYEGPPAPGDEEHWFEALRTLHNATSRLLTRMLQDTNALRVDDLGRIAAAAARLLRAEAEGVVLSATGQRLMELGQATEALPHLDRAEQLLGESQDAVDAAVQRLECLLNLKRFAEANAYTSKVATLAKQLGLRGVLATVLGTQARTGRFIGQAGEALEKARQAVALRRQLTPEECEQQSVSDETTFLEALGEIARAAGQFEEALNAFQEGRQIALDHGDARQAAYLLSEIGITWEIAGDLERGAEVLSRAADEAQALGITAWVSRWRKQMPQERLPDVPEQLYDKFTRAQACYNTQPPRPAEARKLTIECIAEARSRGMRDLEASCRDMLAAIYAYEGQFIQAEIAARQAIQVARDIGERGLELGYMLNLANIFARRVRVEDAEAVLDAALTLGETLRAEAASTELRQTLSAGLARAYEHLAFIASFYYSSPDPHVSPRPPQPERLFEIGQRTRAVNLANWLAMGQTVEDSGSAELIAPFLALRAAEVHIEMASEDGDVPLAPLMAQRTASDERFRAVAATHGIRVDRSVPVYSMGEVCALLAPGECIVDLLSLNDVVSINCFGRDGTAAVEIVRWKREERTEFLRTWGWALRNAARADVTEAMNPRSWRTLELPGEQPADASPGARFEALSAEMKKRLLEPIAEEIHKRGTPQRIFVLLHRELSQVPFWWLAEHFPGVYISLLPSPSTAAFLQRRHRTRSYPWLACGDATGTLRFWKRELDSLASYERCDPIVNVLLERLRLAGMIHLCGHGYFNADNPYRSGLVMAASPGGMADPLAAPDPYGLGCELLTVAQILGRLHLQQCYLAVLSACYTGLPRQHPASEFTSLPAALLMAGARNVIASLWPAHDGAATLLMQEFYAVLGAGEELVKPSQALAEARRRLSRLTRDEVVDRLGDDFGIPKRDLPFAALIYTDAFQHYGVD